MRNYIDGKVVIVTGAGGGFGRLVCEMAAARGARVVAADINAVALDATGQSVREAGGHIKTRVTDVADRAEMHNLASFAVDAYGAIDIMINNAGTMPLAFYADHAIAADAWERCIDINLKGVLNGITAVYDQMIRQSRGQIINISSIYGNFPNAGAAVYSATKAAVNVLSEALRVESQGKIKVTIIKPTGVPMTGLGASVVNAEAIIGILGHNLASFGDNFASVLAGGPDNPLTDVDSPTYWTISPEQIAETIIHVMDQPWGVSISDITVRATGEQYLL